MLDSSNLELVRDFLIFARLAQLARASRLHRECRGFKSLSAHQSLGNGRVVKWYTRSLEVAVTARSWRFNSSSAHQNCKTAGAWLESKQMDLASFLTKDYIFASVPPVESTIYLPLSIFFGLLILVGILLLIFAKDETREIWGRYIAPSLTVGLMGLMNLGARYEQLPWLASRFVLILAFTVMIVWFLVLAFTMTRFVPEFKKAQAVNERFSKYLPRPKKNKAQN